MSSKVYYPSLSEDGWVNSSIKVADNLLSDFFLSEYSQSYIYNGTISSLPWIIQHTQGDMTKTITLSEKTLSEYFSKYFNNVVVEVAEVLNSEDPSKGQISIYISFTDSENKQHNVAKMLEIADMKIQQVININNGV